MARGDWGGWASTLIAQPAAWTMPLAFIAVIVVSKLTPHKVPAGTARIMVRLHAPEAVDVDRGFIGSWRPPGTARHRLSAAGPPAVPLVGTTRHSSPFVAPHTACGPAAGREVRATGRTPRAVSGQCT